MAAAALFAPSAAARPAASLTRAPATVRVMEFNIEYGGMVVRFASIVEAIEAADADVVALEEAWGNVRRLAKALDYPYYNVRLQVVSRLPLIDPPGGDGLYLFVEVAP